MRITSSVDLITSALQTSRHCAIVVVANSIDVALHAPARLRRIESRLTLRPTVAFELVGRLLFFRLAILGVNDQIIG
jgi:hypothetical protein